jgi:hypothetical protein
VRGYKRIHAWLLRTPEGASKLFLKTLSVQGEMTHGVWDAKRLSEVDDLAKEVAEACHEVANGEQKMTKCVLTWETEHSEFVGRMVFRAQPNDDDATSSLASDLDGTVPSLFAQLQKHMEGVTKLLLQSQAQTYTAYERVLEMQQEVIESQSKRIRSLEGERAEVMDLARDAQETVQQAEQSNSAMDRVVDTIEKHIPTFAPLIVNKVLGSNGMPPVAPPAPEKAA